MSSRKREAKAEEKALLRQQRYAHAAASFGQSDSIEVVDSHSDHDSDIEIKTFDEARKTPGNLKVQSCMKIG